MPTAATSSLAGMGGRWSSRRTQRSGASMIWVPPCVRVLLYACLSLLFSRNLASLASPCQFVPPTPYGPTVFLVASPSCSAQSRRGLRAAEPELLPQPPAAAAPDVEPRRLGGKPRHRAAVSACLCVRTANRLLHALKLTSRVRVCASGIRSAGSFPETASM